MMFCTAVFQIIKPFSLTFLELKSANSAVVAFFSFQFDLQSFFIFQRNGRPLGIPQCRMATGIKASDILSLLR